MIASFQTSKPTRVLTATSQGNLAVWEPERPDKKKTPGGAFVVLCQFCLENFEETVGIFFRKVKAIASSFEL